MSEKFKYDIFLSHSSKDKPIIRDLAKRLKRDGLRIWFDEWEIKPGDVIPLKIQQGLEQSRTLVLAMSTNAFTSEWVTLERNTVLFRDPNNTDRRFIPIRLDESKIPDTLRQFAYIPWQQPLDDHYINLLTACRPNAVKRKRNRFSSDVLEIGGESVVCIAITVDGQRAIAGLEDGTVKVWDLASRRCVAVLQGHSYQVESVAVTANGQRVLSGSEDGTLRIWDIQSKKCVSILDYSDWVTAVAVTADGQRAISGSDDGTIQIWNLNSKKCITTLEGHLGRVTTVAVTADGRRIISSSTNGSVRIWEIESNKCLAVVKYPNWVTTMAVTADGRRVISGSDNGTVRIWDIESKDYIAILEGHTDTVTTVAVTADGRRVISGSTDKTVRVWDIDSKSCVATLKGHSDAILVVAMKADGRRAISASRDGRLLIWNLPALAKQLDKDSDATRYTNAKVVLVGETGVGKTGLALRLCEDRWEPTESTHGMRVLQLKLSSSKGPADVEREIWLWDFAGQPDYRLIHQLYMDETALALLIFDPQDDNPFEELSQWEKALHRATKQALTKILVAARCDRGGITISKKRFEQFCSERGFAGFITTSSKINEGCEELKATIARSIPWNRLPWIATTRIFKALKDAILKLKDEDTPLIRFPELLQRLQLTLRQETISTEELRAVIGLMEGQGMVQMLAFGDFILLQPEQVNCYASVVVRMAREHADEMGVIPEEQILEGKLDYKGIKRLNKEDEKILLRAMTQTFLDRALCFREQTAVGTILVFPSYFRRDKPDLPEYPNVFVTMVSQDHLMKSTRH